MNRFGTASENVSPAMLAMEKWIGNYKPALSEAGLQALFLTRTARGQGHLLETHTLIVQIKETSGGSDQLELVSARVEPMDFLEGCFGPETHAELIEEVRGKEEREKQSSRVGYRIIGSMVICIHCLDTNIRQVLPTGIPYTVEENSSGWPVDPNWERTLKDRVANYRFFCAPDTSTYAVPRERPAAGGFEKKGSKKKKSGSSA